MESTQPSTAYPSTGVTQRPLTALTVDDACMPSAKRVKCNPVDELMQVEGVACNTSNDETHPSSEDPIHTAQCNDLFEDMLETLPWIGRMRHVRCSVSLMTGATTVLDANADESLPMVATESALTYSETHMCRCQWAMPPVVEWYDEQWERLLETTAISDDDFVV